MTNDDYFYDYSLTDPCITQVLDEANHNNTCSVCGCASEYEFCSDTCYFKKDDELYDEDDFDNYDNSIVYELINQVWDDYELDDLQ